MPDERKPPLPLALTEGELERIEHYLGTLHRSDTKLMLLIEILGALRQIDDKLARLIEKK